MTIMCIYLYMNPITSLQTPKLRYPVHYLAQNTLTEILIDTHSMLNSVLNVQDRKTNETLCCLTSLECSKLWTMPPSRIYFLGLHDVHFCWNFPVSSAHPLPNVSVFSSYSLFLSIFTTMVVTKDVVIVITQCRAHEWSHPWPHLSCGSVSFSLENSQALQRLLSRGLLIKCPLEISLDLLIKPFFHLVR